MRHSASSKPVEVDYEDGICQLDECEYLFVEEICPCQAAGIGLVLAEAKPQGPIPSPREIRGLKDLVDGGRPVNSDTSCRLFEVLFEHNCVVYYSVLNESYSKYPEPTEAFTGKLFRNFTHSHLLEYISKTSVACNEYPGPLRHYQISAANHVIDVITTKSPRIAVGKWKNAK